jgi:hypothetical protein
MLVRLRLIDPGGTPHQIGGARYHFGPRDGLPAGVHVADVADPDHVRRFLAIDGFEPYDELPDQIGPEPQEAPDFSAMTRDELSMAYRQRFGRAPRWNLSENTMRDRLRAGTEV